MRHEGLFFRDTFRPHLRFPDAPCRAWFAGPAWLSVLTVETGVGPAAVAHALDWLLAGPAWRGVPYRPKVLVFAGFAGALDPALRVGDVFLADEVVDGAGRHWPTTWPGVVSESRWEPPLHRGRLLATPQMVATPDAKARLAESHQARAVDMESAVFAERCTAPVSRSAASAPSRTTRPRPSRRPWWICSSPAGSRRCGCCRPSSAGRRWCRS